MIVRDGTILASRVLLAFLGRIEYHPRTMTSASHTTRIYVDADACPVKDEIYRVAARHGLPVSVVAGNFIRVPQDPLIERIAAGAGMDAADDWIADRAGTLFIQRDQWRDIARCSPAPPAVVEHNRYHGGEMTRR